MVLYPQSSGQNSDIPQVIDGQFEVTETIWEDNVDLRAFVWYNSLSTRLLTVTNVPPALHDYIVSFRKHRRQDAEENKKDINANILGMCDALRAFQNRAGETLVALLYRYAHDSDARELESMLEKWAIESLDKTVLKLISYFESIKNRNRSASMDGKELVQYVRDTGDINTVFDFYSSKNPDKPPRKETLIMWLCRSYCTDKNYLLFDLIEELLKVPGIDINILNQDNETLLGMVQNLYKKYELGTPQSQNAADLRDMITEYGNDISLAAGYNVNSLRIMRENLANSYVCTEGKKSLSGIDEMS